MTTLVTLIAIVAVVALVVGYIKAFRRAWREFRLTRRMTGWQIFIFNAPLILLVANPVAMLLSITGVSIWRTMRAEKSNRPATRVESKRLVG